MNNILPRYYSYLNNAVRLLENYKGEEPFANYLKKYFRLHKKFGSNDRREIAQLCYGYFRLGKAVSSISIKDRLLLGLKNNAANIAPLWKEIIVRESVPDNFPIEKIFPWENELSEGVDSLKLVKSFLIQPDLFIRIRPGKENKVQEILKSNSIDFIKESPNCLRLQNSIAIDQYLSINEDVVIQDKSSQQVGHFLLRIHHTGKEAVTVYDVCAGSGGKSLLANDLLKNVHITASDLRMSIIKNLDKRFRQAGMHRYQTYVADITKGLPFQNRFFDIVLADVPCTGSGTWARTPEQLYFFAENKIDEYAQRQKHILLNAVEAVRSGGYLLYITCSVFKKENERQVELLVDKGFQIVEQKMIGGYQEKADSLFGALLKKNK